MKEKLEHILSNAMSQIEQSGELDKLNEIRVAFLGKKGELTSVLKSMKPPEAAKMPVGLPTPSPIRNASSFAPILRANSFVMYAGRSKTLSFRSSSEILIAVPTL